MIPNNFISAAAFTPNSLQYPNAWVGHLPFAAWVIQEVSPKIFVELGTHSGNSYFSFCQSVVEAGLSTKCYAVDTWQGDEHAGQYGDEIFAKVNAHHQEHYAEFSRLLRMTFDDAATYFADESIELLHIDGLHTYEAVRHDFETWLPKLAPGAVVMFHDTNVRERNFGVWKLWEELQARYPNNLEFVHSHGLGVLQLNNAADGKKLDWLQPNSPEKQRLINYFASLGSRQLERFELNELKQQAASLNQAVTERDGQIASLNQTMTERDGQIASLNHKLADALKSIEEIRASSSWRITSPIRFVSTKITNVVKVIKLLPNLIRIGGGVLATAKKVRQVFAREGWVGVKRRIMWVDQGRGGLFGTVSPSQLISTEGEQNDYGVWVRRYDTLIDVDRLKIRSHLDYFKYKPLFSVVMPVYNPPIKFFEKAIQSVRNQLYPNWELCIADDASTDPEVRKVIERHCKQDKRIKAIFRTENGHISKASNSALEVAQGDFIAMLDHDDAIPEHALYLFAEALNCNPELDFLYSDQDKIDTHDVRYDPYFKPDFNPDLLRSQNFVDHLAVFRTWWVANRIRWQSRL